MCIISRVNSSYATLVTVLGTATTMEFSCCQSSLDIGKGARPDLVLRSAYHRQNAQSRPIAAGWWQTQQTRGHAGVDHPPHHNACGSSRPVVQTTTTLADLPVTIFAAAFVTCCWV